MSQSKHRFRHRGATAVEFAITCPIAFFLIFATMIGALGAFRYQQVASLARDGARWASVHGTQYAEETGQPAATASDIYENAIVPSMVGLDASKFRYEVSWNKTNSPLSVTADYSVATGNNVTVKATYDWIPDMYFTGPISLTSTSTAEMAY
jgi:Flp pilus assembly protein TadG